MDPAHIHPVLRQMPADWPIVRIDDLFVIQQGKQVSARHRDGNRQRSFLRTKNVLWGRLDLTELDAMHFSEKDERRLRLLPGDLLTCEGGWVGRTAIWNGEPSDCLYQNHLHRLRRISTVTDPWFALYWLWYAFDIGEVYFGRQNVTTIPNLSKSRLGELLMPSPSGEEQRKIAAVLSAVQRAVERQERLIALAAELKKALMHKLFTEGPRGEPLKQTEIGPLPESWTLGRLRDFLTLKHGYAFDGAFFRAEGDRILMTPGHFDEEGGFRDQGKRTKYYVGEVPSGYTLAPNDLLVAMTEQTTGLLGSAALVPAVGTYLHNQRLGLVTSLNEAKLTKNFLYYFFTRPEVKAQVASTAAGSKVRHTSPGKLLDLIIALPPVHEQKVISSALQGVDAKRKVHRGLREALSDLFRTLLHQLLTAQVRVHDIDLSVLEDVVREPAGAA